MAGHGACRLLRAPQAAVSAAFRRPQPRLSLTVAHATVASRAAQHRIRDAPAPVVSTERGFLASQSFEELGLDEDICTALAAAGFTKPASTQVRIQMHHTLVTCGINRVSTTAAALPAPHSSRRGAASSWRQSPPYASQTVIPHLRGFIPTLCVTPSDTPSTTGAHRPAGPDDPHRSERPGPHLGSGDRQWQDAGLPAATHSEPARAAGFTEGGAALCARVRRLPLFSQL